MAGRVSQDVVESLVKAKPNARGSQSVAEVEGSGTPNLRGSQSVAEVSGSGTPNLRGSQSVAEVAGFGLPIPRAGQFVIEVLLFNFGVGMPPVYPSLPGLAYSTFWNPTFANLDVEAANLANIDLAMAATPIHEFELSYDFFRDKFGANDIEFKTFMGFWLRMGGQQGRFLFKNSADQTISGQSLGTTDGTTSVYSIQRTYGVGENVGTEPVGYVDLTLPVRVYLDRVLQDTASYQILTTQPMAQQLKFSTTPGAGHAITIDMSYFYYCKFSDNTMSFEQFMRDLWATKKVLIKSCRAAT